MVTIRRIAAEDLEVVRRLRLAALSDAPSAFEATLAEEQGMPEEMWQKRLDSNIAGVRTVGFLAVVDGIEQGLVAGVRDADIAALVSLWVAPCARGRGAGRALIEAVCDWAKTRACVKVVLSVTETNAKAIALYRNAGFDVTGEKQGRTGRELEMTRYADA